MLGNRPMTEWIAQYSQSHQTPVNRVCHMVGIPLIAASVLFAPLALFLSGVWRLALTMFVAGWVLQFIGHAFEGKPPEFFKDPRFLLVGLRWWLAKLLHKA